MKIRTAFFSFAVAMLVALPMAQAQGPHKFVMKRGTSREHISTNPVVMGAQDTRRGWVSNFCGPNECAKDKWSRKNRTRAMRPRVKAGAPSAHTYIAR